MLAAKTSMEMTYKRGDSGQPWRMLREGLNQSEVYPLIRTVLRMSVYKSFTHLIKDSPNPTYRKVERRKPQSTWSKAFSWSNDKMAAGRFNSFATIEMSLRKATFSPIKRPFTPHVWFGGITWCKTLKSRPARVRADGPPILMF